MKEFDARNVAESYYKAAKLKTKICNNAANSLEETVAKHVFGTQQLAWLFWSESGIEVDILHVISILAFHEMRRMPMPSEFIAYGNEFKEAKTIEAKFANLCNFTEQKLQSASGIETKLLFEKVNEKYSEFCIEVDDFAKAIERYKLICNLKAKVRQGWNYWHVKVPKREVVAEHIFGTQTLAELMYLEGNETVNVKRVCAMLSLHETEEVLLPDYTPYDGIPADVWEKLGEEAIKAVLGDLRKGEYMISLIREFNKKETPEGKFAYLCDKLECNLQVKRYCDIGACTIEGGGSKVKNDKKVQNSIADGAKTVSDIFLAGEMHKYVGTNFGEVAKLLKTYDASK